MTLLRDRMPPVLDRELEHRGREPEHVRIIVCRQHVQRDAPGARLLLEELELLLNLCRRGGGGGGAMMVRWTDRRRLDTQEQTHLFWFVSTFLGSKSSCSAARRDSNSAAIFLPAPPCSRGDASPCLSTMIKPKKRENGKWRSFSRSGSAPMSMWMWRSLWKKLFLFTK